MTAAELAARLALCPHAEHYVAAEAFRVTGGGRVWFVIECRVTCTACGQSWQTDDRHMAVIPADPRHLSTAWPPT